MQVHAPNVFLTPIWQHNIKKNTTLGLVLGFRKNIEVQDKKRKKWGYWGIFGRFGLLGLNRCKSSALKWPQLECKVLKKIYQCPLGMSSKFIWGVYCDQGGTINWKYTLQMTSELIPEGALISFFNTLHSNSGHYNALLLHRFGPKRPKRPKIPQNPHFFYVFYLVPV